MEVLASCWEERWDGGKRWDEMILEGEYAAAAWLRRDFECEIQDLNA